MNNNVLHDFYYGNIVPNEKRFVRNSEFGRAAKEISEADEYLHSILDEAGLAVLDKLTSAQMTLDSITAEENYIDGFKTGARFVLAIMDDKHGDTRPVTE